MSRRAPMRTLDVLRWTVLAGAPIALFLCFLGRGRSWEGRQLAFARDASLTNAVLAGAGAAACVLAYVLAGRTARGATVRLLALLPSALYGLGATQYLHYHRLLDDAPRHYAHLLPVAALYALALLDRERTEG